eukprot:COSAG01_NODE_15584_length_1321_cov_1.729951_2_plen_107_part_01
MFKIYRIVDNTNNNVYIGLTSQTYLSNRISYHKSHYKDDNFHCSSKEILKNNNWHYELVEETDDKTREHYHIQNTPNCINTIKFSYDRKLVTKKHYIKNKTKILQYN